MSTLTVGIDAGRVPTSAAVPQRASGKRPDTTRGRQPAARSARGAWVAPKPAAQAGTIARAAVACASADGGIVAAAAAAAATVAAAARRRHPKTPASASKGALDAHSNGYPSGLCGNGLSVPRQPHTIIAKQYCYDPPVRGADSPV